MKSLMNVEAVGTDEILEQLPAVSIVLPFEPKMESSPLLEQKMKGVLYEVKEKMKAKYRYSEASEVLLKLNNIISHLNYQTHKKSLAIFVSPTTEKVYYLDIPVHEKVLIDEPFGLRDLIYNKKEFQKYLLLILSGEWTRIYLGNGGTIIRLVSNIPDKIDAFRNDLPEKVANFSDPSHRKEVLLKKFLHYTDNGLKLLLEAYPLPVFVMGPEKLLGYFRHITKNTHNIVGYAKGNFINVPEAFIREAVAPLVSDWKLVKERNILNLIEASAGAGKLAVGLRDVLREAKRKKGRLLIVENDFHGPRTNPAGNMSVVSNKEDEKFFIRDAVDQAIEYVLESGGDVEYVEEGSLEAHDRIALIQYY